MYKADILIVEDDADIMRATRTALELEGYRVAAADTLAKARAAVSISPPDLIILDILLPDGNGLDYCEELRGASGVRILFLSALNTRADVLAGLRAGGDDYISKPYDMDELLLRIEALLRRGRLIEGADASLRLQELEMDLTSRRAMLRGKDILLKPKEFALLYLLARQPDRTISVKELYERAWGMQTADDARSVKEHVSRIRTKLRGSGLTIVSQRGMGYRLMTGAVTKVAKS